MYKKIAIVADIHANKYALDVFLKYVEKNKIKQILNLGDFVQIGPNPKDVVNLIINDRRFINILGNNETSLFDIDLENDNDENRHRYWTRNQIQDSMKNIREYKKEKIVNIEQINFLMIHSRKEKITDLPLIYTNNLDEFVNDYKEFNVEVILFGHTHEKMYIEHNNKILINPGSLGCSKTQTVDFAIIELEDSRIRNCSFKSLDYNLDLLLNDFKKFNVPDKEFIMKTFYNKNDFVPKRG